MKWNELLINADYSCVCVCARTGWCLRPARSSWAACLCLSGSLWSWGLTWPWLAYFRDSFRRIPGSTTFSVPPTVSSIVHPSVHHWWHDAHDCQHDGRKRQRMKTGLKMASVFQNWTPADILLKHTQLIWAIWDTAALIGEEKTEEWKRDVSFYCHTLAGLLKGFCIIKTHAFWELLWWKQTSWSRICANAKLLIP